MERWTEPLNWPEALAVIDYWVFEASDDDGPSIDLRHVTLAGSAVFDAYYEYMERTTPDVVRAVAVARSVAEGFAS